MTYSIFKDNSPGFEVQEKILNEAPTQADIVDVIGPLGWSIDDLKYQTSKSLSWDGERPKSLNWFEPVGSGIPFVSFFTGCGGMDLGFEAVGFKHKAAFEISEVFCNTLRVNRPDWKVFGPPFTEGDVSNTKAVAGMLSVVTRSPFEGVFVGGPPCQPFSIAANQRFSKSGENFKRVGFDHKVNGSLLFDFIELIVEFRPLVFVIENVPGLRDLDGGMQLSLAVNRLQEVGYNVEEPSIYNAADYGVPQYRQRMFVVGSRCAGRFKMSERKGHIGSGSVLSNVPSSKALNHDTRNHKVGSIARYMQLDYGQRDQLGRVDRLDPNRPSKTVIAGGSNGGGRSHLHPEIPRTLSVRECARLQTFPDGYKFVGSTARQFTQVGNAVPPLLAAELATQIVRSYSSLQ